MKIVRRVGFAVAATAMSVGLIGLSTPANAATVHQTTVKVHALDLTWGA